MSDDIIHEVRDGVARITFNRPHLRNALTAAMIDRLGEICADVEKDRNVKILVLAGAGTEAFATGPDVSEFHDVGPAGALDVQERLDRALDRLANSRVPTIGALTGSCSGGGAAIAACCDLRIGASNLRFGFPMARTSSTCLSTATLGRLSALLGMPRVKDLVFTARMLDARDACATGLLSEVMDDPADVGERADELARLVADHAPLTLRATKEAFRRLESRMPPVQDEDLLRMCYTSKDFKEAIKASTDRRRPVWRGE